MLVKSSLISLLMRAILCLFFISCSSRQEYRIQTLWKFVPADESERITLYYLFDKKSNQLKLRLKNLTDQTLSANIQLRIYDSRHKDNFYETPEKSITLQGQKEYNKYEILTFELKNIETIQSLELSHFVINEDSL